MKTDTILHTVIQFPDTIITKSAESSNNILSMDNPLFGFLALIVVGLVTWLTNYQLKKHEFNLNARKIILEKRLDIHNELYQKITNATQVVLDRGAPFCLIFKDSESFRNWSNDFSEFQSKNWMYFSVETKKAIQHIRLFQQLLVPKLDGFDGNKLPKFSNYILDDWFKMTDNVHKSIERFLNTIDIKQEFRDLTEEENKQFKLEFKRFGNTHKYFS